MAEYVIAAQLRPFRVIRQRVFQVMVSLVARQWAKSLVLAKLHRGQPALQRARPVLALVPRRLASLLASGDFAVLAEQNVSAWVNRKPLLKHGAKERRQRRAAGRPFATDALLFVDPHGAGCEIHVGDFDADNLASPGPGVGGEAGHWVEPRRRGVFLEVAQHLVDFGDGEIHRVPQLGGLFLGKTGDLPLDLGEGLEGRLFVRLGEAKPLVRELPRQEIELHAPIPARAKRVDFLLDRRWGDESPDAFHPGAAVNVALEVGKRNGADEKVRAKAGSPVLEVLPHSFERVLFERAVAVHCQILVTQFRERETLLLGQLNLFRRRRLAVVLNEGDDVAAGRDFEKMLLEAKQEVINLGRNRLGLGFLDLAEIEPVPFSLVAENAIPDAVSFLEGSHCCSC